MTPNSQKIYGLLSEVIKHAPSGAIQHAIGQVVEEMRRDNVPEREILLSITGFLFDGLAFGNWLK